MSHSLASLGNWWGYLFLAES